MLRITPLIQERLKILSEAATTFSFFFVEDLPNYDKALLIPQKGDAGMALIVLQKAVQTLGAINFTHAELESALRADAESLGLKPGQMFQPIRVAVCGQMAAPPLFDTLIVMGQEQCVKRVKQAIAKLQQ
jgi:glutamyl-tRNA synthetase